MNYVFTDLRDGETLRQYAARVRPRRRSRWEAGQARILVLAAVLSVGLVAPVAARASGEQSGSKAAPAQVVVGYERTASQSQKASLQRATGTAPIDSLPGQTQVLRVKGSESISHAVETLRAQPGVRYAVPNFRLHAAGPWQAGLPNDPGNGSPGDWIDLQWNFAGAFGVNAPHAWGVARAAGAPGGKGVTVAVIDSGIAYRDYGQFRRAPDLPSHGWVDPYDFISHNRYPLDRLGHGTLVAGTIAQSTDNGVGLTGLAYGVKIMPLRVLDSNGDGDGATLAKAIRYAVDHHAQVINMSVAFDDPSLDARSIPEVISAIRYGHGHGVIMVGASGNEGSNHVDYPARDRDVLSVGATTADGCLARYSNYGRGLAVVAPGGENDANLTGNAWDRSHCHPRRHLPLVYQQTFKDASMDFGLAGDYGTSIATPHVTAIAALILATHVIGRHPAPDAVEKRVQTTARDLGATGSDSHYGAGLVDAGAAIKP